MQPLRRYIRLVSVIPAVIIAAIASCTAIALAVYVTSEFAVTPLGKVSITDVVFLAIIQAANGWNVIPRSMISLFPVVSVISIVGTMLVLLLPPAVAIRIIVALAPQADKPKVLRLGVITWALFMALVMFKPVSDFLSSS